MHKKQSGGAGQFARVIGYLEPTVTEEEAQAKAKNNDQTQFDNIFEDKTIGTNVPNEYKSAIENQFYESCDKGPLTNYPILSTKFVLLDGETHVVDS